MNIEKDETEITAIEILGVDPNDLKKIQDGIPQYAIDRLASYFYRILQGNPNTINETAESGSEP